MLWVILSDATLWLGRSEIRAAQAALFSSKEIFLVTSTDHEWQVGGVVQTSEESNPFREGEQQNTNLVEVTIVLYLYNTLLSFRTQMQLNQTWPETHI